MAFQHKNYRDTKNDSDDSDQVISDEDSEINFPVRRYKKKNLIQESDEETVEKSPVSTFSKVTVIEESSDEKESEDDKMKIPFHSTKIIGHEMNSFLLSNEELEEMHLDIDVNRKLSSAFSDKVQISSASSNGFCSDNDIVVSDEELQQQPPSKPKKSARISLALGKILSSVSSDEGTCLKIDEKNVSGAILADESSSAKTQNSIKNHDVSSNPDVEETLKYNRNMFSEEESMSGRLGKETTEPCACENTNKLHADQGAKCFVQAPDDSIAVFSYDDDDDDNDSNDKPSGNIKETVESTALKDADVIELSSEEETDRVINVESGFQKLKTTDIRSYGVVQPPQVSQSHHTLQNEIDTLSQEVTKLKKILRSIDVSQLPDNGMKLQMKLEETATLLKRKERELKELPKYSTRPEGVNETHMKENIKPGPSHRLPVGFGMKSLQNQVKEKTLTDESLKDLHGSLNTCPGENIFADDPLGLKSSVSLMPHQKHALAWMQWRENQKPPAGILADDMGLGKTLTMISLVLKTKEENYTGKENNDYEHENEYDDEPDGYTLGGTLVVCPASLLLQWDEEVRKHCKRGILDVEIHHGSGREENARILSKKDLVITTYSIVRTSEKTEGKRKSVKRAKKGVLHRIRWRRIILDEAHVVRNHKSQQSIAACLLMGRKRWALTGTPIHNKELDLYALLKFLRCSPFDDYNVWRRWVDNKTTAGIQRLNTLINTIMLRRTKHILQEKGELDALPEKSVCEIFVHLDKKEYEVYTKILWLSKTLFAQFLQQRADKEQLAFPGSIFSKPSYSKNSSENDNPFTNHPELGRMFNKMKQMHDVKTHEILVLLLRLRQICVHPGLIKAMLDQEAKEIAGFEHSDIDKDVLSQFTNLSLGETSHVHQSDDEKEENILQINNPVFDLTRLSSKLKTVLEVLEEKVLNTSDKAVIVSQWTSVLNIIHEHMLDRGIKCGILTGAVCVKDRMDVVKSFNSRSGFQILLLSLTAGGVGLNLTGGNHLLLVDLHWNPQLESQAFDRIYRFGQKKPVFVYKFVCQETIEESIKNLQDKKKLLAEGVLSGTLRKDANKLTLDDLKSLFSM